MQGYDYYVYTEIDIVRAGCNWRLIYVGLGLL